MSWFECRHGERYYPFGQGGRDNLIKGLEMTSLSDDNTTTANTSTTATQALSSSATPVNEVIERLKICPLHAFPLSQALSSTTHLTSSPHNSDPSVEKQRDQVQRIYSDLVDDVILEIFKQKISDISVCLSTTSTTKNACLYSTTSHNIIYTYTYAAAAYDKL